jgi:hypothetical protein
MFKIILWRYYRHVAEEENLAPFAQAKARNTRENLSLYEHFLKRAASTQQDQAGIFPAALLGTQRVDGRRSSAAS